MDQPRSRALTMVELLVVVAVIAVLIGIVVPVVAGARRHSPQSVDISNMRQLATAIALYRDDCGYPPFNLHDMDGTYVTSQALYLSPADPTTPSGYGYWACLGAGDPAAKVGDVAGLDGIGSYPYVAGGGEVPGTLFDEWMPHVYTRSVEEPGWGILACTCYLGFRLPPPAPMRSPEGIAVEVVRPRFGRGVLLRVAAGTSLRRVRFSDPGGGGDACFYLTGQPARIP